MELWTALVLGFVGSFHCVGMCGPIAMSIPAKSSQLPILSFNALVYNFGRILTYALFGLFFGLLGTQITISGFQGWLSILLGGGIIIGVIFNGYFKKKGHSLFFNLFKKHLILYYGMLLRKQSTPSLFGMGILNGLLPCAFVYSGLATAVLTETAAHSMGYMALFGIGTFPAMFLIYLAPTVLSVDLRTSVRKLVPYLAFSLGLFLIVRGVVLQDLYLAGILGEGMESFCVFPGANMK